MRISNDCIGLLTEKELANTLGVSISTVRRLRYEGSGPAHVRVAEGLVRYRSQDVAAYIHGLDASGKSAANTKSDGGSSKP